MFHCNIKPILIKLIILTTIGEDLIKLLGGPRPLFLGRIINTINTIEFWRSSGARTVNIITIALLLLFLKDGVGWGWGIIGKTSYINVREMKYLQQQQQQQQCGGPSSVHVRFPNLTAFGSVFSSYTLPTFARFG